MGEINQVTFIATKKTKIFQSFFCVFHRPSCRITLTCCIINQFMVSNFHVNQLLHINTLYSISNCNGCILAFSHCHSFYGMIDCFGKCKVCNRLQNIIKSLNLVAFHHILWHVGNKNNHHFMIQLSDFLCCFHSIDKTHLNIHQNNIEVRFIGLQNSVSICKFLNLETFPQLCLHLSQIFPVLLTIFFVVFHNCNCDHNAFPLLPFPLKL